MIFQPSDPQPAHHRLWRCDFSARSPGEAGSRGVRYDIVLRPPTRCPPAET